MARKSKTPVTQEAYTFHAEQAATLGQAIAQTATQTTVQAGNAWAMLRTAFVDAQANGKAREFTAAFFDAGDKVKGKKASWYRLYKHLCTGAVERNITVTNDMGATALQKVLKEAKADSISEEAKQTAALTMFTRMAQGALNAGVTKAKLAEALKGLSA